MATIWDAITAATSDARTQLAMLIGSGLESNFGANTTPGDAGSSFGPWQFHFTGPTKLGLTPQQAADPLQSARAIAPTYQWAVDQVPTALWVSDPKQAAAQAAYLAEQPARMYPQASIDSVWSTLGATVTSGGVSDVTAKKCGISIPLPWGGHFCAFAGPGGVPNLPGFSTSVPLVTPTLDALPGIGSALGKIGAFFGLLVDPHTWAKIGLTLAGVVLVAIGAFLYAQSLPEVRAAETSALKATAAA